MARVRDGDREAFETLYERYGAPVMGFLYRLCRDRALAEDLTQETFLRAWAAAPRWEPTGRVSTWLFQIAKRAWWKRRSRRLHRRERETRAARARARGDPPQDAERRLLGHEAAAAVRAAVGELSPRLRVVFVLVRLEGLPYAEAARIAGIRLGTCKSRMAAAEAFLRKRLGDVSPP
jgi:RNA polymerase sigma-70 factor (ECF subfamily)